jgi:hypothetical protein
VRGDRTTIDREVSPVEDRETLRERRADETDVPAEGTDTPAETDPAAETDAPAEGEDVSEGGEA